ncbi:SDR family NAD(P)-dependent oxidoreductase [Desulfobacula sp.]|uniref:SDR family NAD(P)-dependent oxidoreductase n=1 Tax=Desulfobacula sp. TaxID=2593537 RepID=UPI00260CD3EC|nr:SDR family NAD(P)-dependent oxidoreductase [Desulfobacula sp.]
MIVLKESIDVNQTMASVFKYTSDFKNIQEWDPGVISSVKKQLGNPRVGSIYDLTLKFGPFRPKMTYVISEYSPYSKVILNGKGESFKATDTIAFVQTPVGTRIDYRADIQFSGLSNRMEYFFAPALKRSGKKAILGLKETLNHGSRFARKNTWFSSGSNIVDYMADHTFFFGMLMFSKLGYLMSRRFWAKNDEILYGKKVVITGGTSGIGRAAAIKLAEKKADLTIIARNEQKAVTVCQAIIAQTGNSHVDFLLADLGVMADIKQVAKHLIDRKKRIDVLINNAGALFNDRTETSEGFERTFATDLLGVFYLTQRLKDSFSKSGARIINVSSGGMYTQKIDVKDLQNTQQPYDGTKAYARAKRAIVILTELWAQQMSRAKVAVNAMHPGWVDTPGIETALPGFHSLVHSILRTPEQGADTIVWLAASKEAGKWSGKFWLDRRPHETIVFPKTTESEKERQALWVKLNRLTARF